MPHSTETTVVEHHTPSSTRDPRLLRNVAVVSILFMVLTAMFLNTPAWRRWRHTCAICRLERTDVTSPLGGTTSTISETVCSRWYREQGNAAHAHLWIANPSRQMVDWYGNAGGAFDNQERPGRAIWRITPQQQLEIYQNGPLPQEAARLFQWLTTPAALRDHNDLAIIAVLRDWTTAGHVEPWEAVIRDLQRQNRPTPFTDAGE